MKLEDCQRGSRTDALPVTVGLWTVLTSSKEWLRCDCRMGHNRMNACEKGTKWVEATQFDTTRQLIGKLGQRKERCGRNRELDLCCCAAWQGKAQLILSKKSNQTASRMSTARLIGFGFRPSLLVHSRRMSTVCQIILAYSPVPKDAVSLVTPTLNH